MCAKQLIQSPCAIGRSGEEQHTIHQRLKLDAHAIIDRQIMDQLPILEEKGSCFFMASMRAAHSSAGSIYSQSSSSSGRSSRSKVARLASGVEKSNPSTRLSPKIAMLARAMRSLASWQAAQ